jgi:hypothetical protein
MSLLTSGVKHDELSHNLFARLNRFDRPLLFTMGDYFHITKALGNTTIFDNQDEENTDIIFVVEQEYDNDDNLNLGTITVRDFFKVVGQFDGGEDGLVENDVVIITTKNDHSDGIMTVYGDFLINNHTGNASIEKIFEVDQDEHTVNIYKYDGTKLFISDGVENIVTINGHLQCGNEELNTYIRSTTITTLTSNQSEIVMDVSAGQVFKYSTNINTEIGAENLEVGSIVYLIINNTSGSSIEISFDTPIRVSSGVNITVPTGTTFGYTFISDGSNLYEAGVNAGQISQ